MKCNRNNLLEVLGLISIIFAFISFIICIYLVAERNGFEQGFSIAENLHKTLPTNQIIFSDDSISSYDLFEYRYIYAILFLGVFLAGKLWEVKLILKDSEIKLFPQLVYFILLSSIFYNFWKIFYWHSEWLKDPYVSQIALTRIAILKDWMCFLIVITAVLILIQLSKIIISRVKKQVKK